jgi:drug/metabolite transporter (DMT)-like permease
MKLTHLIILLAMNLCWAGVYSANMVVGRDLATGGIVTIRFGLAGLCLLIAWPWLPGSAPRGRDLVKSCVMGLILVVLGQRLQVYGNQLGTAGNSAVLMAVEPLITSLAAALFLREHIGPRRLAGFGLGMCGVVLLNGVWRKDFQWTGLVPSLIFISSFVCEAAYSVMGKPIVARASVMKMLALSLLFGTAANLLIDGSATLRAARTLPAEAWFLLLALAVVCTAVGYSVWFIVIRECPVNVAALTIFIQSVFGVAIAALWLEEKLHWGQLFGSITIVAGLTLGLSRQIQRPAHRVSTLAEPLG